jgi:hypothetical protein
MKKRKTKSSQWPTFSVQVSHLTGHTACLASQLGRFLSQCSGDPSMASGRSYDKRQRRGR